MKKLFVIFIFIITIALLSACGRDQNVLRVAMDLSYPPFETVDTSNNPEGISVDIAYALGQFLGRPVEIVNTDFASIIPALQSGEVDIAIASMSITEQRKQSVDFTEPYFYFKIIALVNQNYATANNLTEDSTAEAILALTNTRFAGIATQVSATIPESYGKLVTEYTELPTAIESVSQGTADILLMSANPVVDGNRAHPSSTLVIWSSFRSSPIGMAVKKGNTELLNQANEFIKTLNQTGGLYEVLAQKYDALLMERLGRYGLSFYINE
jgi:polar amino acid transport system substrate-binding protein